MIISFSSTNLYEFSAIEFITFVFVLTFYQYTNEQDKRMTRYIPLIIMSVTAQHPKEVFYNGIMI